MDVTLALFGKLVLSSLLGTLVGTERVAAGKHAGTRTFALVAMGSCLLVGIAVTVNTGYLGIVNFDPMRIAAGIVQGIGFIGAGLIILRDNALHGLTTAAGLWVACGVGIAVGFGLYAVAIFATFLTLLIFTIMWRFEMWVRRLFEFMEPAQVTRARVDSDGNGVEDDTDERRYS